MAVDGPDHDHPIAGIGGAAALATVTDTAGACWYRFLREWEILRRT